MKIEILGTGCPKCQKLYDSTAEALNQSGVEADIIKVTALSDIAGYGVMMTPALVIDGEVKAAGKVPSVEEIINFISS